MVAKPVKVCKKWKLHVQYLITRHVTVIDHWKIWQNAYILPLYKNVRGNKLMKPGLNFIVNIQPLKAHLCVDPDE